MKLTHGTLSRENKYTLGLMVELKPDTNSLYLNVYFLKWMHFFRVSWHGT